MTNRANDISKEKKRAKVLPGDIMQALSEVGFDKFNDDLKAFLQNYDAMKEEKREQAASKRQLRELESAGVSNAMMGERENVGEDVE